MAQTIRILFVHAIVHRLSAIGSDLRHVRRHSVSTGFSPDTGNIIRLCANTGARLHLVKPLGFCWRTSNCCGQDWTITNLPRSLSTIAGECAERFSDRRLFAVSTKGTRTGSDLWTMSPTMSLCLVRIAVGCLLRFRGCCGATMDPLAHDIQEQKSRISPTPWRWSSTKRGDRSGLKREAENDSTSWFVSVVRIACEDTDTLIPSRVSRRFTNAASRARAANARLRQKRT